MTVAPESIASVRGEDAPLIQIKRSAACHFGLHEAGQLPPKSNAGFFSFAMVASMWTGLLLPGEAHAVDLSGAWAAHADECSEVFIRKGRANQIGFRALSGQHGGGSIVEADRLRGKFASCKIKSRKEDGQTLNIVAGCATDIMLSNVQFSLKVLEPNKISRTFPRMPEMEASYYRCPVCRTQFLGWRRSVRNGINTDQGSAGDALIVVGPAFMRNVVSRCGGTFERST
jgi:hypothetical protein